MRKLLIALIPALLVVTAVTCGEDEEVADTTTAPSSGSPTATVSSTPSVTPTVPVSGTPTPTQAASPTPTLPGDWPTYSDPGGLFTMRYPAAWFKTSGQAQFSSYDLSTLTGVQRPPESITVEVSYHEASGSDTCAGTISTDPKSGEDLGPMPGATATTLGSMPGWELIRVQGDPAISEEDLTRIHRIAVVHRGFCLFITAYYTQQSPDVGVFLQMADTFEFIPPAV